MMDHPVRGGGGGVVPLGANADQIITKCSSSDAFFARVAGIDMISHGPNGVRNCEHQDCATISRCYNTYVLVRNVVFPQISFSSTTGFTWTAGGVLSIESERTVGITAGTTIMMTNPAVAASTSF